MADEPRDTPADYIREALEGEGLTVTTLDILDYDPQAFGNLVAEADTSLGRLRIIYDRSFWIEADPPLATADQERLTAALTRSKRNSH